MRCELEPLHNSSTQVLSHMIEDIDCFLFALCLSYRLLRADRISFVVPLGSLRHWLVRLFVFVSLCVRPSRCYGIASNADRRYRKSWSGTSTRFTRPTASARYRMPSRLFVRSSSICGTESGGGAIWNRFRFALEDLESASCFR